jgi:dihydrofolate synthase/folylpolyglutamate synthase
LVIAVPFDAEAASPPQRIVEAAQTLGLAAETAPDLQTATARALQMPGPPHVLICGSLYLAGEVLSLSPETWPT